MTTRPQIHPLRHLRCRHHAAAAAWRLLRLSCTCPSAALRGGGASPAGDAAPRGACCAVMQWRGETVRDGGGGGGGGSARNRRAALQRRRDESGGRRRKASSLSECCHQRNIHRTSKRFAYSSFTLMRTSPSSPSSSRLTFFFDIAVWCSSIGVAKRVLNNITVRMQRVLLVALRVPSTHQARSGAAFFAAGRRCLPRQLDPSLSSLHSDPAVPYEQNTHPQDCRSLPRRLAAAGPPPCFACRALRRYLVQLRTVCSTVQHSRLFAQLLLQQHTLNTHKSCSITVVSNPAASNAAT